MFIKINGKKLIRSDLVINVSGPVDLKQLNKETNLLSQLKNAIYKVDKRGFITNKNFMLTKQIFMPVLSLTTLIHPGRQ